METTVLCTWATAICFPSLIYGTQSNDLFEFQSLLHSIPDSHGTACILFIWDRKTFQACPVELAWEMLLGLSWQHGQRGTFLHEIQQSKSETINAWREFSCGIVYFLMFSNLPFSQWGHACGQLMSGFFGWLNNCDLGVVQELLPCPAPTQGSSPHTPQQLEPCSPWPGRLQGVCLAPREELVSMLTQTLPGLAQSRCSTCGDSLASSSPCCWTIPYPAYISETVLCVWGWEN